MIKVSIIVISFNTRPLTLACLKFIFGSRPKINFEVIVVDNASEDGSVQALRKLRVKNLRLIANKKNLGFAKANNQGIRLSKGEYVILLNSDTQVKKGAIDKLVDFADRAPDAGAVVPRLLNKDGTIQGSVFEPPTVSKAIRQYWLGKKGLLDKYAPQKGSVVKAAVMAAFLVTPLARKKVGVLDERYFMYFEDFDYCRRLRRANLKIYYLAEAEIVHLHGASGGGNKLLVESAKKYHGLLVYYVITFIIWSGQKWQKLKKA
jgi:GT2 family glycosyltransferase